MEWDSRPRRYGETHHDWSIASNSSGVSTTPADSGPRAVCDTVARMLFLPGKFQDGRCHRQDAQANARLGHRRVQVRVKRRNRWPTLLRRLEPLWRQRADEIEEDRNSFQSVA